MKKTILILGLLLITVFVFAQAPDWQWATKAGGNGWDEGFGITIDDAGNSYITGYFLETATFGSDSLTSSGDDDIFVAKMDANGNWIWVIKAGGTNEDRGESITIDIDGNCYVTGYFRETAIFGSYSLTSSGSNDVFVAKIDANGNWEWVTKAGGSISDICFASTIDNAGNSYVTGYFQETATFGSYSLTSSGIIDIFVAKMDANGNWEWATKAGGSNEDLGRAITLDNSGNSYVTGYFRETATFGSYTLTSSGTYDIYVAKMDAAGTWQWATKAGGSSIDLGTGISIDEIGNSYVTGSFEITANFGTNSLTCNGDHDIFVAKIDSLGVWQWAVGVGGFSSDSGEEIIVDSAGCSYVTGYFVDTVSFGSFTLTSNGNSNSDSFVGKIDSDGNWLWATKAGGSSSDWGQGISINEWGYAFITGMFQNTATFGSYSLTSSGGKDIFVAKLESDFGADFYANPNSGLIPLEVNFAETSTGFPTNWFWDFQNDGVYDSFQQNPTYTYTQPGIYDVKLKISNEAQIDSLIKYNYITVEYVPPAPPTNVEVNISGDDAIITWTAVDTTIFGTPINIDYYIIENSKNPYNDFIPLGATPDTMYTHYFITPLSNKMFYQIKSFVGTRAELDEYVERYLRKH